MLVVQQILTITASISVSFLQKKICISLGNAGSAPKNIWVHVFFHIKYVLYAIQQKRQQKTQAGLCKDYGNHIGRKRKKSFVFVIIFTSLVCKEQK